MRRMVGAVMLGVISWSSVAWADCLVERPVGQRLVDGAVTGIAFGWMAMVAGVILESLVVSTPCRQEALRAQPVPRPRTAEEKEAEEAVGRD